MFTFTALVCFLTLGALTSARGEFEIAPARVKEIAAMLPAKPAGLGRPITDRGAWEKLARAPGFAAVVAEAEKLAKAPAPVWSDELYLDFSKTGNRERGQQMLWEFRHRLEVYPIAECLENKGRFLAPLEAIIAAICAQSSWMYPAHDGGLKAFHGESMGIDLGAVARAWNLATVNHLLGDKLTPATRNLIRDNLQRRIFTPYHDMVEGQRKEAGWMRQENNWNAVCLGGVTGAALAMLESPEERAWYIAAAQHYIQYYFKSFPPDGYCTEGIGYWVYGYGHFLMLGEAVRQATSGKVDFLADPVALQPALFAMRAEIINDFYPTISDVAPGTKPPLCYVRYVAERLGLPLEGERNAIFKKAEGPLFATALFAFLDQPLPPAHIKPIVAESPLRTWFADGGVLICRPTAGAPEFAVVLKGGHNGEQHNHNDVGSFSVVMGRTMLLCDPGAEIYTRRTFSPKRYDSKVLSSYGHAVPVVAGDLQSAGKKSCATVLKTDFNKGADTLALDIRAAYPNAELQKLERTFTYQRGATPGLTVRDEFAAAEPATFETALITWSDWKKVSDNELQISEGPDAVRIKIDTGGRPFQIKSETLEEDVRSPRKPVRIGIALASPVKATVVKLVISPQAGVKGGK